MQYPWPGARPNSAGVIAGVTYVPWNRAGSPIQFLNLRFAAQYVSYTEFNGNGHGAGANNGVISQPLGSHCTSDPMMQMEFCLYSHTPISGSELRSIECSFREFLGACKVVVPIDMQIV